MKINKYDARASQDITIDELPKQDNPNNSDLVIVQSSSLTEATSIQQLRNKILSGSGGTISEDLGIYIYSATKINNNNYLLMDGTQFSKLEYPDFYNWLSSKSQDIKLTFSLDTAAETFRLPNYKDTVPFIANEDGNFYNIDDRLFVGTNPDLILGISPVYCYIKVKYEYNSTVIASPFIKSDGTVAMDLDYTPNDMNDVATKKYIDNKFLNYEIPLSFSINDIGKRIPYYKNAETNPVLIALDGTKYLIADYPDFDYTNQEGFTNDGTYFWFADLDLEIVTALNNSMNKNAYKLMPCFSDNNKGQDLAGDWTFNSKLIYNFLQSSKGSDFLIADGSNIYKSNEKFTILDPNTYLIRKNYNSYINAGFILNNKPILNFKTGKIGKTEENTLILGGGTTTTPTGYLGTILGEASYLKIKPDYMVAKIQQVGSVAGTGDVKADRSVLLTGSGAFNTKQVASMDDLKDTNIIVGGTARVITTLDTKLVEIDTNIVNINSNISTINNNITNLQTQTNTVYKFARKLKRTATTSLTIAGNASKRILDDVIIDTSSPYNDTTSFTLEGTTNKIIREKDDDYKELEIVITLGHTANMGATKFEVQLWRNTPTPSIVRWGSKLEFNDTDERGNTTQISTFKAGINDPYVTNGYYIVLRNLTGTVLTYSIVDILIKVAKDKLLG